MATGIVVTYVIGIKEAERSFDLTNPHQAAGYNGTNHYFRVGSKARNDQSVVMLVILNY